MRRYQVSVLVAVMACVFACVAYAEKDVKPLIKKGEQAVSAGEYQAAIDHFQQVIQELQSRVSATLGGFMPKALPGWEAGKVETQSWSGTGDGYAGNMTNISQTFTRTSDGKVCEVSVVNWPQIVEGMKQSVGAYKQMSEMMSADPNMSVSFEERGEWTILRIVDKNQDSTTLNGISEGAVVMVVADYADAAEADKYLAAMNLAGIATVRGANR